MESEKTAKWQYTKHCEELTEEIKKLRTEVGGREGEREGVHSLFTLRDTA